MLRIKGTEKCICTRDNSHIRDHLLILKVKDLVEGNESREKTAREIRAKFGRVVRKGR